MRSASMRAASAKSAPLLAYKMAREELTMIGPSGRQPALTVAAASQTSVLANEILPNSVFGAGITSDRPVYAERTTLGDRDGTAATGMTPGKTWYFAEGQTGDDFTTWLLVLNPGTAPAALTVTYYPVEGKPVVKTYTAPPTARLNIAAQADMEVLCNEFALPRLPATGPAPAQIIISLSDRAVAFGEPAPEATQFFEAYTIIDGRCQWEPF